MAQFFEVVAVAREYRRGGHAFCPRFVQPIRPAGSNVTAVSGATWYFPTSTGTSPDSSVKTWSLTRAQIALDGQRRFVFTADGTTLAAGSIASSTATFDDTCPAGSAVVGFSGRSGAYIDATQTQCAPLTISYTASGSAIDTSN